MQELILKYKLSLKNLTLAIDLLNLSNEDDDLFPEEMENIIQEAVIKRFEYCCDLSQSLIKPKLIENSEMWIEMQKMRKISSKSYEPEILDGLCQKIIAEYHQIFINLNDKIKN